jgi:3D (Asp-Asp-Asp) domain-containing protein
MKKFQVLIIPMLSFTFILLSSEVIKIKEPIQIVYAATEVLHTEKTIDIKPKEDKPLDTRYLGEFKISFYDADKACTGTTSGITKTGAHVTKDLTVAVDPRVIPLGSYIYIEGIGIRKAQDTGGAIKGQAIDVYVPTHTEAKQMGTTKAKVYIIKINN